MYKEPQEQRESRLAAQRDNAKRKRAEESQKQRQNHRLAFRYSQVDDYSLSRCVQIGTVSKICPYCKALKFNGETMGMCCVPKESVPRNHKNNVKISLRLKEIMQKESVPKNHKSNVKIIAWHSGTAQSMIIA